MFRPHCTLRRTLVNLKNGIPLQQQVGVVYRIPCGTCLKVYVGQTCRTLDHRLKEHRRALTSGNLAQSAIAEYAAHDSHQNLLTNWFTDRPVAWPKRRLITRRTAMKRRCQIREEGQPLTLYLQLCPKFLP